MNKLLHKEMSDSIMLSRFILCVLIVFIHSRMLEGHNMPLSNWVLNFMFSVSCILCDIAVPAFMFFSSYLLFIKYRESDNDFFSCYTTTLKKRVHTLVIPYVVWNILGFFIILLKYKLGGKVIVPNLWEIFVAVPRIDKPALYPADGPLWFLRDLIILNLLSPLIYFIFRRYSKVWLFILLTAYLIWGFPDFYSANLSIPYFLFGALCALSSLNLYVKFNISLIYIVGTLLIYILLVYLYINGIDIMNLRRIFYIMAILSLIQIPHFIRNAKIKSYLNIHSRYSFFIYAFHFFIIGIVMKLSKTILQYFFSYDISVLFTYLLTPVLVIYVCIITCDILNKKMAKFFLILNGNRSL